MTARNRDVAVIAGGSAGVGRATARAFAIEGYRVAILARGAERVAEAEAELAEMAPAALGIACDVGDAEAVKDAAKRIEDELGPISVWVNSAMLTVFSPFEEMSAEEFSQVVATTLLGTVNGTRAALEMMRSRNRGRIIMVGSGLGYRSVPLQSAYCASKHGVVGFAESLRSELLAAGSGISISMVQLPALNTPQFDWARNRMEQKPQPAPPIYEPEVAARAIIRAAHSGSRELFVGKSVIQLVLGNMVLPNWLDRRLAEDGPAAQQAEQSESGARADNLSNPIAPSELEAAAAGSFKTCAKPKASIVDADRLRLTAVGLLIATGAVLGLAAGAAL